MSLWKIHKFDMETIHRCYFWVVQNSDDNLRQDEFIASSTLVAVNQFHVNL